jgi:hypothetical protein
VGCEAHICIYTDVSFRGWVWVGFLGPERGMGWDGRHGMAWYSIAWAEDCVWLYGCGEMDAY